MTDKPINGKLRGAAMTIIVGLAGAACIAAVGVWRGQAVQDQCISEHAQRIHAVEVDCRVVLDRLGELRGDLKEIRAIVTRIEQDKGKETNR